MSNSSITPGISATDSADKLAMDANSLNELRRNAKQNTPESIKATAKQFEALFVNMMLKSMREAAPQNGPFDNEQTKTFTSMMDQQLSQKIASRGIGLADMLEKQMLGNSALSYTSKHPVTSSLVDPTSINQQASSLKSANPGLSSSQAQAKAFQSKLADVAESTSQSTGIPAKFMLGQAALESGWGKHEIVAANGQPSHNIFGIKAGSSWKGKVVTAMTTEYVNGVATKKLEKFRAYDNYGDAFKDYAQLLQGNARYKNVIANAKDAYGFAHGLQKAGYATDPEYANKIMKVITKSILA